MSPFLLIAKAIADSHAIFGVGHIVAFLHRVSFEAVKPEDCVMLLVDFQAGLGFGVESIPLQLVLNNAVGLARTAVAFNVPVIASNTASRVYCGPLLLRLQEALPSVKLSSAEA